MTWLPRGREIMLLRSMLVAFLVAGLGGCASLQSPEMAGGQPPASPDAFAHRTASNHLVLYWNCAKPAPDALRVEGIAQNPGESQEVRSLEFELVGVDSRERAVSEVQGTARDPGIGTNQTSPFLLDLPTVGGEVRFDLYYDYQFSEGDQTDALLAGPPMVLSRLSPQGNRFLVRDVCSESQHRRR
jgi:hypothetical protein